MSYFPTLSKKENSAFFSETREDPTVRTKTDGGYMVSRPKHTRAPRRTISTGFSDLSNTDKETLEDFYDTMSGGAGSFTYIHPTSGVEIYVRFAQPFTVTYAGVGEAQRWDVKDIKLEEI